MAELPEDLPFVEERWVRIMAGYGAEGVWRRDGSGESADALPVPASLSRRTRCATPKDS